MKYNDLEKTQDLFDIEENIPKPIENIEMEGASKNDLTEDLGLTENTLKEREEVMEQQPKKTSKKNKKSLKEKWTSLPKKKKILLIIIIILIILLTILLILVLTLGKKKSNDNEKEKEPVVIVEKENYIYEDGILKFLNADDKEIGTYECQNKDEDKCYVASYSNEDNFDGPKNVYEDETLIERRSAIYLDNYVFIADNSSKEEKIILYNIKEQKEEGTYALVKGFADSEYVILKDDKGNYGLIEFIDDIYETPLEFKYDYIGMASKDSDVVVEEKNKYTIYSKDGKALSKPVDYEIKSYNKDHLVVDNKGYYVYDFENKLVSEEKSEFISLLDDYFVLINDNKLYIRDYDNNKYNEEGIKLSNDNYNPLNIYDKNKTLLETKEAYTLNLENNTIEVKYKNKNADKSKMINTYEGKLSSELAYLNYFDGNLYFYKDEEKEELLGKYSCTNKNTIEKNTKVLTTCTIATESFYSKNTVEVDNSSNLGWLPIFNERYVFILDSIDEAKPTIILHDLKDNKTLSKYASVDAGSYTKEAKLSFAEAKETNVMAKNKSNKYGMIKIGDSVTSAIPFNYDELEKMGEYYMVKESSGTYQLLDEAGQKVTDKYGYKITDYHGNYLKVMDNDHKCYIYDFEGNRIDDTGYKDIILYDDYYVLITQDNKLNIGEYKNSSFSLSYDIDISEYYENDYEITRNSNGYTIKIKSTNKIYLANSSGYLAESN